MKARISKKHALMRSSGRQLCVCLTGSSRQNLIGGLVPLARDRDESPAQRFVIHLKCAGLWSIKSFRQSSHEQIVGRLFRKNRIVTNDYDVSRRKDSREARQQSLNRWAAFHLRQLANVVGCIRRVQ